MPDRPTRARWSRTPELLIAIKRAIDGDRRPGRFVLTGSANLLAMKPVQVQRPVVHHWRTATQREVDFVVEMPNGAVLPIEVKATTAPGVGDAIGLRAFLDEYGDVAVGGLLLHGGDSVIVLGRGIIAAPWWMVV